MDLKIRCPDDWHVHLRDGVFLGTTVPHVARQFQRAIVMPNLKPPVVCVADAVAYRDRVLAAVPDGVSFEPLMTLFLHEGLSVQEVIAAKDSGVVFGVKWYPKGSTTNSESGVSSVDVLFPVLEKMEEVGLPLLVHGEVVDVDVDIFDREKVFIDRCLALIVKRFARLKVVFEHITTVDAVQFVLGSSEFVGATITPQHLLFDRNQLLVGGIRPHFFCLPVLKRRRHQEALVEAATGGNEKFFLGTDSAPHVRSQKESACGCAGCFSSFAAIELYAEAFDKAGALDRLEGFASLYGAQFYGLPVNEDFVVLRREAWEVPESFVFGDEVVVPLLAGERLQWKLVG